MKGRTTVAAILTTACALATAPFAAAQQDGRSGPARPALAQHSRTPVTEPWDEEILCGEQLDVQLAAPSPRMRAMERLETALRELREARDDAHRKAALAEVQSATRAMEAHWGSAPIPINYRQQRHREDWEAPGCLDWLFYPDELMCLPGDRGGDSAGSGTSDGYVSGGTRRPQPVSRPGSGR
jgi:hypothetical protein